MLGGYQTASASGGEEALDLLSKERFDLLLSDVMMPRMNGLELLREARRVDPEIEVVLMTAFGNIEGAVQAIQGGAANYITKPFPVHFLQETIRQVLKRRVARETPLEEEAAGRFITEDPAMRRILKKVEKVAASSATVLIQGETGTGKELLARYLHLCSPRRKKNFLAINCAAIPRDLLESELFGHERGAFTGAQERKIGKFEAADGGTLLLDEVGEMEMGPQAKILRVLQEKEFFRVGGTDPVKTDTRLVAATNRNLKELVGLGRFREDLFYRLHVIPIRIPPLRERKGDIPLLVRFFLKQYEKEHRLKNITLEAAAMERLKQYPWPGNVRELENVVLRAAVTAPQGIIREEGISLDEEAATFAVAGSWEDREREAILQTLKLHQGNKTHAARALGISLRTLRNKIRLYRAAGIHL
jgi:two-component system response regulator FlrC